MNSKRVAIDQSQFGLLIQKLLQKRNFPKIVKMTISGSKRWNLAKNRSRSGAKLLISTANDETH